MSDTVAAGAEEAVEAATLLDLDPGRFRCSLWHNVSISLWAGQATLEAAVRVRKASERIIALHPEGHCTVVFILNGAPAPTPEASAIFSELYDPKVSRLSCMAVVLEGVGFWASVMRSTITRMRLAAVGGMTMQIHDSIEQAVAWLVPEHAKRCGVVLDPEKLQAVLRATRALAADGDPLHLGPAD